MENSFQEESFVRMSIRHSLTAKWFLGNFISEVLKFHFRFQAPRSTEMTMSVLTGGWHVNFLAQPSPANCEPASCGRLSVSRTRVVDKREACRGPGAYHKLTWVLRDHNPCVIPHQVVGIGMGGRVALIKLDWTRLGVQWVPKLSLEASSH